MELILIHKNDSGITPLYIVCVRDNLEIVNYLINGISGRIRIQENTMEIMNLLYLERFFNPDITHQELTYIFNELE